MTSIKLFKISENTDVFFLINSLAHLKLGKELLSKYLFLSERIQHNKTLLLKSIKNPIINLYSTFWESILYSVGKLKLRHNSFWSNPTSILPSRLIANNACPILILFLITKLSYAKHIVVNAFDNNFFSKKYKNRLQRLKHFIQAPPSTSLSLSWQQQSTLFRKSTK